MGLSTHRCVEVCARCRWALLPRRNKTEQRSEEDSWPGAPPHGEHAAKSAKGVRSQCPPGAPHAQSADARAVTSALQSLTAEALQLVPHSILAAAQNTAVHTLPASAAHAGKASPGNYHLRTTWLKQGPGAAAAPRPPAGSFYVLGLPSKPSTPAAGHAQVPRRGSSLSTHPGRGAPHAAAALPSPSHSHCGWGWQGRPCAEASGHRSRPHFQRWTHSLNIKTPSWP